MNYFSKTVFTKVVVAIIVCASVFVSRDAFAGTCTSFCQGSVTSGLGAGQNPYTMVVAVPGGSCGTSATCTQAACNIPGYSAAIPSQVQRFCELIQEAPYRGLAAGASWCGDYTSSAPRRWEGQFCRLDGTPATAPVAPPAAATAPVVTSGTTPARATPDQAFRCVYACAGDAAPRIGNTCAGATDTTTCAAQCNTTCARTATGGSGCLGVAGGPQPENTGAAPRCAATVAAGATPSVGGLVDSQRFETVNETFTDINIPSFIARVVRILIGFAGALFFAMLVWGGVRWMTAGGDADAVKKAQTTTMNAIIGVIIIALAYTVVTAFMQIIVQLATPS